MPLGVVPAPGGYRRNVNSAGASKQWLEEELRMKGMKRIAVACAALGFMSASGLPAAGVDRAGSGTMAKVRRALERLPYYGVSDFLAFGIENGVVTLMG
jgi:hypothetical protein